MGDIVEVDDSTWESIVEKGARRVAVMFHSPTCAYCAQIEPYFKEQAKELKGKALFARLNTTGSSYTAGRYGIMSTPTFKFFCNGRLLQGIVGAMYPPLPKKATEDVLEHGAECARKSTKVVYEMTGYAQGMWEFPHRESGI